MEKQLKTWKSIAITAICLLLVVSILFGLGVGRKQSSAASEPLAGYDPLSLWTADAEAKSSLISFVEASVQEGGAGYIPVEDRIAVFDMDGTLTCETFYTYYDTMMFIEYCLNDHPERVSDELKAVAASIKPGYVADETLARNFAKAYAGMTVEEFYSYVAEFGQKYTASFNNMRYIDGFYLPMVELVKYLYDNGFEIWVISGTERTTTRAIVANSPIRDYVEPEHVIGTDFEVKQRGHEDEPSNMDFKYENGDELVLTGGFIQKNLNGNKSIYVEREIGQRPVLAFGNSGSDTSMMNYSIDSRNPYPAQAYMVVADDNEREWGTQDWEAKSADYLAKGFIPISMKNDFARIYAEGITKASRQYQEPDWAIAHREETTSTDEMKFDDGVDLSAEDGADSVERDGDHADSLYFNHLDFYNLNSTDTLTILPHFKTIQQSSEWSCGVASSLMVLEWYGLRGDYTEESLAALRPQGPQPDATSLSEMVAMFDGVGGFTCYSAIDAGENVHDIFTFDFIRDTLAAGDPILIGWNDWGGHWQVIIGYDTLGTQTTQDDVIIAADPYDTTDHNQDGYGVYGAERFLYNFTFYNFFEGDELNDMCFLVAKPR